MGVDFLLIKMGESGFFINKSGGIAHLEYTNIKYRVAKWCD